MVSGAGSAAGPVRAAPSPQPRRAGQAGRAIHGQGVTRVLGTVLPSLVSSLSRVVGGPFTMLHSHASLPSHFGNLVPAMVSTAEDPALFGQGIAIRARSKPVPKERSTLITHHKAPQPPSEQLHASATASTAWSGWDEEVDSPSPPRSLARDTTVDALLRTSSEPTFTNNLRRVQSASAPATPQQQSKEKRRKSRVVRRSNQLQLPPEAPSNVAKPSNSEPAPRVKGDVLDSIATDSILQRWRQPPLEATATATATTTATATATATADVAAAAVAAAERVRVEAALSESRLELAASQARLNQQEFELSTLRGRSTAVRLAGEEARRQHSPWSQHDVMRFNAQSRAAGDRWAFCDDDLRALLDQARVAAQRRVSEALSEAGKARVDSEQLEAEATTNMERFFASTVQTSSAEHQARLTTRAVLVRNQRSTGKLRAALLTLEREAAAAQLAHASDVRSVAARLVAQSEAIGLSMASALHEAEHDGACSVAGLEERLAHALSAGRGEAAALHMQLEALAAAKAAEEARLKAVLRKEQAGRTGDYHRKTIAIEVLRRELPPLESSLDDVGAAYATHTHLLAEDLRAEEEARREQIGSQQAEIEEGVRERSRLAEWYEAKIRELRAQLAEQKATIAEERKAWQLERESLVARHSAQMRSLKDAREHESAMLRTRIEKLTDEVERLRASTVKGRQMLYWSTMKGKIRDSMLRSTPGRGAVADGGTDADEDEDEVGPHGRYGEYPAGVDAAVR